MSDLDLFAMFVRMFGIEHTRFQVAYDFDVCYAFYGSERTPDWIFYFDPDSGDLLMVDRPLN